MAKKPKVWSGSAWEDLAVNQPDLSNYPSYTAIQHGFRNKLINGDFRINQRAYASGSALSTSDSKTPVGYGYAFDRWKATTSGTYLNFVSAPNGQPVTISANGSIAQIIERENIANGTYTLSWQGTATGRVYNVGASAPTYAASPITLSLDGTANVIVEFTAVSTPQTLNLVQLEQGAKQTAFEYRSIQSELAQCQRYYWRFTDSALYSNAGIGVEQTGTQAIITVNFPVPMRASTYSLESSGMRVSDLYSGGSAATSLSLEYPSFSRTNVIVGHAAFGSSGQLRTLQKNGSSADYVAFNAEL